MRVERPLDAGGANPVEIGKTNDVRGERGLWIESVGLALDRQAGLAERIDCLDDVGRGAAAQVEERLVGAQEREILLLALLRHELSELAGKRQFVADDLA